MENCLFCKIIAGEIPSSKVYEDDEVLAFKDINPMAPVHILIIPKDHIDGADKLNEENSTVVNKIFTVAAKLAEEFHLDNGFRIVTNVGEDGGQTVRHLHFHLLGGQKLNTSLC
ncbi:MAG: histidine triad nucleotide-binding protein [Firmicutes bacterium]|nr:histidine triad nucleotide-binding protein [[Eubacterium] siraeum]MCM1487346.1 histidine triad nucleotide-binding protein [Bacillota bacterium]